MSHLHLELRRDSIEVFVTVLECEISNMRLQVKVASEDGSVSSKRDWKGSATIPAKGELAS